MIFELLNTGKHRPITGSRLAEILGTDTRTVSERIERERKAGKPICATCNGSNPGYYLAETKEDAAEYCDRVSIMVDGHIKALDSPAMLKQMFQVHTMYDVFLVLARSATRSE